jgi:hypothetical protein
MNEYKKYGEYTQQTSSSSQSCKLALGFLALGAGIGTLLSLLFSPRSGREMRNEIANKFGIMRRGVSEQTSRLRQRGSEIAGQARDKVVPMSG